MSVHRDVLFVYTFHSTQLISIHRSEIDPVSVRLTKIFLYSGHCSGRRGDIMVGTFDSG